MRSACFPDADCGPEQVWRATHQQSGCARWAFGAAHVLLREMGYVLWDRQRLVAHGMLGGAWTWPRARQWRYSRQDRCQREAALRSYHRRSEIFWMGGRGWWAEGDESKIRYPTENRNKRPIKDNMPGKLRELQIKPMKR